MLATASAVLLSFCSPAASDIETAIAEGSGSTREEALTDAVIDGARQINGFRFVMATDAKTVFSETGASNSFGESISAALSQTKLDQRVQQRLNACVRGYRIISCEQDIFNVWKAKLEVPIIKYRTPGLQPDSCRAVVVTPFKTKEASYRIGNGNLKSSTVQDLLLDKINIFFTQSRRFAVISRQDTENVLKEKEVILRESNDVEQLAKFGCTLGTDYIVTGEISEFYIGVADKTRVADGKTVRYLTRARARIAYRIVVMPTAQIKWTDEVVVDLDGETLDGFAGDIITAYDYMADTLARELATKAIQNIFPIRVLKAQDSKNVVLDQGGAMVIPGQRYGAYRLGEMMYSPYTKEALGREETCIATIEIARSEAKLSYGKIISGTTTDEDTAAKIVCREIFDSRDAGGACSSGPKSEVKKGSSGGVALPLD